MHVRVVLLSLTLLAVTWAGCFGGGQEDDNDDPGPVVVEPTPSKLNWANGRLTIDVPVPVVTLGLSSEEAAALQDRLSNLTVDQASSDSNMVYPAEPDEPESHVPLGGVAFDNAVIPVAGFEVQVAPETIATQVAQWLPGLVIEPSDTPGTTIFDATEFEARLFGALGAVGLAPNGNTPTLVVLHLDAFGVDAHAWRYSYGHGYLEPVRVFGEKTPILFMDPSAQADPYVRPAATGGETHAYFQRADLSEGGLDIIANFARDAVHFRLLQGSLYPPATTPCHAITLIYAIRDTTLAGKYPGLTEPEQLFHPDELQRAFVNLTGADNVFVDVSVLHLPIDDPALDAISRGDFGSYEAQRAWIAANWQNYWVAHEGCEAYVSFVVHNDAASPSNGGGVVGIGTYDQSKGYRIAMSWVPELFQLIDEGGDPGPGTLFIQDDSVYRFQMVDFLFAHETGHILGQRHPHDIQNPGVRSMNAFSSTWSSMSYQTDGRAIDFGAIDHNNFVRNRAGFMLQVAASSGLASEAVWAEAMDLLAFHEWQRAGDLLSQSIYGNATVMANAP